MKKAALSILLLIATFLSGAAQTLKVEAPGLVDVSERFNVVFVVDGSTSPQNFSWEPGDGFTVVWGPQKGTSTSIQFINGKSSRSSTTTYTYILQATAPGTYILPAATARIKGEDISSSPVTVKVVKEGQTSAGSGTGAAAATPQSSSAAAASPSEDVFIRMSLSRTNVVVGEPVTATLKLFNRANLSNVESPRFPSFNGFWSNETLAPTEINFQREQVGGKIYNAAVLRQWTLIPQKSGELTVDPSEIIAVVSVKAPRRTPQSIFDDFFDSGYVQQRLRLTTPSYKINVSPLPGGAPAGFGGGVGQFSVSASLTRDSLKAHDAASLIVTVKGKGNISLVEAPKVQFPPDFEVYDTKTTSSVDKSGTSGSKTFEFPFIPRSPGEFTIGPIACSYYDISSRKYRTTTSDTLRINVSRAPGIASEAHSGPSEGTLTVNRSGVRNIGEDIRFIKTGTKLSTGKELFVGTGLYWGIAALMALVALAVALLANRAARRRADIAGTRNRKATKMALRRLRNAGDFLRKGLSTAFYEELHRALVGFVSDKLGMDMADQTKENIEKVLTDGGVAPETASSFVGILGQCEMARYSPEGGQESMNACYDKAVRLVGEIDSTMKTVKHTSAKAAGSILAVVLLLGPGLNMLAAEDYPDSLWKAGVEAYSSGDWKGAADAWTAVEDTGLESAQLYYNLGNAWFRLGETGKSILCYERALRLNPSDKDAAFNLAYAREFTQDRIDSVPEFILVTWMRKMSHWMGSNAWAALSLVLFAITLALALLFVLGATPAARKTGFFAGIVTLLLSLGAAGFAFWQKNEAEHRNAAIVMKGVSPVKSSPAGDGAKDLFVLHEGTKVKILDRVGEMTDIELPDGRQGWIASGDLEII